MDFQIRVVTDPARFALFVHEGDADGHVDHGIRHAGDLLFGVAGDFDPLFFHFDGIEMAGFDFVHRSRLDFGEASQWAAAQYCLTSDGVYFTRHIGFE